MRFAFDVVLGRPAVAAVSLILVCLVRVGCGRSAVADVSLVSVFGSRSVLFLVVVRKRGRKKAGRKKRRRGNRWRESTFRLISRKVNTPHNMVVRVCC